MKWFEIKNQSEDKAEVWIYEVIGEDFWGEGLAAKQFVQDLAALDVDLIDLHINSPGGSVWDGQAIYNAIKRHRATVTTYVDGLAASIASVVALAGDSVIVAANSLMMIHKAWALAIGNADDLRESAEVLDKVDETITGVYQRKTGREAAEIIDAMAGETWFTAQEAVEYGLADEVGAELKAAALAIDPKIMARYKHVPETLSTPTSPMRPARIEPMPMTPSSMMDEDDNDPAGAAGSSGGAPLDSKQDFERERIALRR